MSTIIRLVRVGSYLNVSEAELARCRLAMEGIPARLDNAALVLWFWHYSNATGRVKVLVSRRHVSRARLVLSSDPTPAQSGAPPRTCPKCGTEVDALWDYCWSCGAARDGTEDASFFQEPAAPAAKSRLSPVQRSILAFVLTLFGLLAVRVLDGAIIYFAPIALIVLLVVWLWGGTADSTKGEGISAFPETSNERARQDSPEVERLREVGDQILRIWQAAVLGLFMFPPLVVFPLWWLVKLKLPDARLRNRDRWRYRGAWVVSVVGIPFAAFWMFAVIGAMVYILYEVVQGLMSELL
jgi:hypothetical protein